MRRTVAALAVALLTLTVGVTPAGADDPAPLRRAGGHVVDEHGRVVLLRGVNVVWKAAPFVPPDQPGGLDDVDLERIAGHGFNVVRLGVAFEGLMPQKGHVDVAYLDAVAAVVDRIRAHGLYALIDVHQDLMGMPWGNGFPTWAIKNTPALEQLEPDLGFPLNAVRPSHNLAWDFFWADGKLAPADPKGVVGYLTDAVGALADRLADHPGLAGIEILNEAWAGTPVLTCAGLFITGCPLVDTYVQRTWQRLTDRIRQADPDVLVWWEPSSAWNLTAASQLGAPPITPAITDPQVGFAFHDYCAFGELSTYLGAPDALQQSCDLYHDITWQNAARFKARTGLPQLVTEFGNIDDPVELERSLSRSDATFTGWQYWHYGDGFGRRTESSEPFTPTQLQHVVRTYPRATAGTPGPFSFDPDTGEMRYRYTPRDLGAPTEIAVSDVHYPDGYEVAVAGGVVTSAAGAPVVAIAADAGATQVDVVVRRATAAAPPTSTTTSLATGARTLPATGSNTTPVGWLLAVLGMAALSLARKGQGRTEAAAGSPERRP